MLSDEQYKQSCVPCYIRRVALVCVCVLVDGFRVRIRVSDGGVSARVVLE